MHSLGLLVKDGPTMTITPFLTLKLAGKKDAVLARQRARRVASLLSFDFHEQACVAAGTFVVACQALVLYSRARLCFQIENQHLQIFAQDARPESEQLAAQISKRMTGLFQDADPKTLFRLSKPLPPQENPAAEIEVGWIVNQVEQNACSGLFDEIIRQNQEILTLLHEVRLFQSQGTKKEEKASNPHAA
jgi:hypothetical protein